MNSGILILAFFAAMILIMATPQVQAKASLSGTTINIWSDSPAVQHEDNCATLLADVPTKVMACTSPFAATCISVDASINITRGGANNWTNFSVNNCELRMNETADGSRFITSWGNFTVISSNITTNSSSYESEINITANSNFSMVNSFVSEMGWSNAVNRRGLELNSPVFAFSNNTLTNNYEGITLFSGANGSIISNINSSNNTLFGIYLYSSSNNTLTNITATYAFSYANLMIEEGYNNSITGMFSEKIVDDCSFGTSSNLIVRNGANNVLRDIIANGVGCEPGIAFKEGILLSETSNNTLTNITASLNSEAGIYLSSSSNNTITNINASSNYGGITFSDSSNNILTNITANSNGNGIYLLFSSNNNILTNITANSNGNGIYLYYSSNNNILTNISANSNDYGITFYYRSSNNTLSDITANSNSQYGIWLSSSSGNNTFSNFNIWNCSVESPDYACIYSSDSQNNSFIRGTVNNTKKWLVDMEQSNNTLFQDIAFINTSQLNGGINITSTNANRKSLNNVFLNCSFTGVTEATSSNSQLIRQWYVDIYANTSRAGAPVSGANISVWNSSGILMNYFTTNSTGWVTRLNVTAYINDSGTTYNQSELAVNATHYAMADSSRNLSLGGNMLNGDFFISLDVNNNIVVTPVTANGLKVARPTTGLAFNVTDGLHNTFNCSLYIAGLVHGYNQTTANATETSITTQSLSDGTYVWYVNCTDAEGNYATSESRSLRVKLAHVINMLLQITGTSASVHVPGTGEIAASSPNATYSTPSKNYIASYAGGILKSLVFVGSDFSSLTFAKSGTSSHTLGLNLDLAGAQALLAFTGGDWRAVDNRMADIESGKFFTYPNPSLSFGLGETYGVKILLRYTDIDIGGNMQLQSGNQGLTFSFNGTSGSRSSVVVTQKA